MDPRSAAETMPLEGPKHPRQYRILSLTTVQNGPNFMVSNYTSEFCTVRTHISVSSKTIWLGGSVAGFCRFGLSASSISLLVLLRLRPVGHTHPSFAFSHPRHTGLSPEQRARFVRQRRQASETRFSLVCCSCCLTSVGDAAVGGEGGGGFEFGSIICSGGGRQSWFLSAG